MGIEELLRAIIEEGCRPEFDHGHIEEDERDEWYCRFFGDNNKKIYIQADSFKSLLEKVYDKLSSETYKPYSDTYKE